MTQAPKPVPPAHALAKLWTVAGGAPGALEAVTLTGSEPAQPSSYAIGTVAQATIAASALAAAELWRLRCGETQKVAVDMAHAAAAFRSERYLRVDGGPAPEAWDSIAGAYRCGDGRWVRIHTNFPHHRDGILNILGCAHDRSAVQRALDGWKAEEFETAVGERGFIATMTRTPAEWAAHPQGRALAPLLPLEIVRLDDAPMEPLRALPPGAAQPLAGLRVLDLTRVIAGPVCGRTLAAHGADVLRVTGPHLHFSRPLIMDNGRGKRSAHIDLRSGEGKATLRRLLADADVFVQGYRPGAIAGHGFAAAEAAKVRPGIVYASLCAYGHVGPWAGRRGFDSIVQNVDGIDHEEAVASGTEGPKPLPCQALDHGSGYLLALGVMTALARRAQEGGSWHVRVSLAQTGQWIQSLGRVGSGLACPDLDQQDVAAFLEDVDSGFGRLTTVRHAAQLSATPAAWTRPSVPLGTHAAEWAA